MTATQTHAVTTTQTEIQTLVQIQFSTTTAIATGTVTNTESAINDSGALSSVVCPARVILRISPIHILQMYMNLGVGTAAGAEGTEVGMGMGVQGTGDIDLDDGSRPRLGIGQTHGGLEYLNRHLNRRSNEHYHSLLTRIIHNDQPTEIDPSCSPPTTSIDPRPFLICHLASIEAKIQ